MARKLYTAAKAKELIVGRVGVDNWETAGGQPEETVARGVCNTVAQSEHSKPQDSWGGVVPV